MRALTPTGKEATTPSESAITSTLDATSLSASLVGDSSPPSGSPTIPPPLYTLLFFLQLLFYFYQ